MWLFWLWSFTSVLVRISNKLLDDVIVEKEPEQLNRASFVLKVKGKVRLPTRLIFDVQRLPLRRRSCRWIRLFLSFFLDFDRLISPLGLDHRLIYHTVEAY